MLAFCFSYVFFVAISALHVSLTIFGKIDDSEDILQYNLSVESNQNVESK